MPTYIYFQKSHFFEILSTLEIKLRNLINLKTLFQILSTCMKLFVMGKNGFFFSKIFPRSPKITLTFMHLFQVCLVRCIRLALIQIRKAVIIALISHIFTFSF